MIERFLRNNRWTLLTIWVGILSAGMFLSIATVPRDFHKVIVDEVENSGLRSDIALNISHKTEQDLKQEVRLLKEYIDYREDVLSAMLVGEHNMREKSIK